MQKKYILFIDSGIGGLSTLAETIKLVNSNFIYYADNKNAPYGEKNDVFLKERLSQIILEVSKKYQISMIVLACNTATTSSISYLRKKFNNFTIIGTEPAIKLAFDKGFKSPALIATPQTINHVTSQKTSKIKLISCKNLANITEQEILNPTILNYYKLLKEIYKIKSLTKGCDCLILGCTHYPFAKAKFKRIINNAIIDGNHGVAQRIYSLNKNFASKTSVKLIISQKNLKDKQKYKKILNQILANQFNLC